MRLLPLSIAIGTGLFFGALLKSQAHEAPSGVSYPLVCCSDRDCRPAPAGSVREAREGYVITATGEVVPYADRRIKQALDTEIHVCQQSGDFDTGRVLCLFPAMRGF